MARSPKVEGISYEEVIKVKLDGKHIGNIKVFEIAVQHFGGVKIPTEHYQYFPKGSKTGGDLFTSLEACKASLEAE